jgi:two-component system phosphate regulon sensor histidine kinase PhoR
MFRSLRARITVPFVLLIAGALVIISGYFLNQFRLTQIENLQTAMRASGRLLADGLADLDFSPANAQVTDDLAQRWSIATGWRVTLIDPDGVVLGESDRDAATLDNHAERPEIIEALAVGSGSSIRFSDTLGYDTLYTASRVDQDGRAVGVMRLAVPLGEIESSLSEVRQAVVLVTLIVFSAASLLTFVLASRMTRPISDLTASSKKIAAGDLNARLLPRSQDEVGDLARAFNQMSSRLQQQIQALETERTRAAAILEQMSSGVTIVDNQGRIDLMNDAAATIFDTGVTPTGQSLVEISRDHRIVELWELVLETQELQLLSLERPQQRDFIQVIATPLSGPMADSTLFLFQDVTRIRQLETVRKDFISNISHELRTPFASLKALTETLLSGALDDKKASRRFLTRIEIEVDALTLMVQELLELSRIESGRVPLVLGEVQPCGLISAAADRLTLQAQTAELDIQVDCPASLPTVMADGPRAEQVLMNLLHNAIKFTPAGGTVLLNARVEKSDVLFMVKDSGVGITVDDLPRIFERFYKTDRARAGGGTGLGLAISKHLVEAHGGVIWAESDGQNGSIFYFTLPNWDPDST